MLEGLENSYLASLIRSSTFLYPIIETIHILGFVILVGSAFMFDLRLLGISRKLPVVDLGKHLLPWSQRSLFLVIPSGLLLFISNAQTLAASPVFLLKLILIAAAFINAGLFHLFLYRRLEQNAASRMYGKLSAILSIFLWVGVLTCGRFLAYV